MDLASGDECCSGENSYPHRHLDTYLVLPHYNPVLTQKYETKLAASMTVRLTQTYTRRARSQFTQKHKPLFTVQKAMNQNTELHIFQYGLLRDSVFTAIFPVHALSASTSTSICGVPMKVALMGDIPVREDRTQQSSL